MLSTEGVDLREDDHNLASGQIIQTTADTPVNSTSMTVSPIPVALLAGAQLTFDGAGMSTPVQVSLTSAAPVGSTTLSILQIVNSASTVTAVATVTDIPAGAQARDSGVNAATGIRLIRGCQRGTSKVKFYCNSRYDDTQLVLAGTVNDWATLCAAKWLCTRRAQGCPRGIMADCEEAIEMMKGVQSGAYAIEDIGTRGVDWPTVTNIRVSPGYDGMQARVEPNISEQTPTVYNQYIDWSSAFLLDY